MMSPSSLFFFHTYIHSALTYHFPPSLSLHPSLLPCQEIDLYALHFNAATVPPGTASWNVYGSNAATLPVDATDPSWVLADTETGEWRAAHLQR